MLGGQVTPILSSYFFSWVKRGLHTKSPFSRLLGSRLFVVSEESLLSLPYLSFHCRQGYSFLIHIWDPLELLLQILIIRQVECFYQISNAGFQHQPYLCMLMDLFFERPLDPLEVLWKFYFKGLLHMVYLSWSS